MSNNTNKTNNNPFDIFVIGARKGFTVATQNLLPNVLMAYTLSEILNLLGVMKIIGAIFGPGLLRILGVHSPEARGMALGMTAHAVGTSAALQESEECGAFAALAMSLMGVGTAVFLPLAVTLVV